MPEKPVRRVGEAQSDFATVKAMAEQLPSGEQLRLAHDLLLLAKATGKPQGEAARYASDFYGIWQGTTFDEEDFKAVEWYLPNEDPD